MIVSLYWWYRIDFCICDIVNEFSAKIMLYSCHRLQIIMVPLRNISRKSLDLKWNTVQIQTFHYRQWNLSKPSLLASNYCVRKTLQV